jgi:uncharacterized repeat protein (TIGR03803 family)
MMPIPTLSAVARGLLLGALALLPAATLAQTTPAISTIVAFSGSQVSSGPVLGPDGGLYGVSAIVNTVTGGLIWRAAPDGSSMRTLYQLRLTDATNPVGGLLVGSDGLLYGTTSQGALTELNTAGTVFRVAPDGTGFTVLHRFRTYTTVNSTGAPVNADGANPESELIEGSDGRLYGTTRTGGPNGTGVVFRIGRDGSGLTVLHAFGPITSAAGVLPATNADGANPVASVLELADGYLYGTASGGGPIGNGLLFRLRLDGSGFEVLHQFPALVANTSGLSTNAQGATPVAGLTDGQDGRLYGVANLGGTQGNGTVFAYDPVGRVFTTLHNFDGNGGARPTGELLLAQNGALLGTTVTGGTNNGSTSTFGTVYTIARDGTGFSVIRSFAGSDGSSPSGRLLQTNASTFIGIAAGGGRCSQGVLYQLSLTGATVDGITNCARRRDSGGGHVGLLPLLLLAPLLARRFGVARA